LPKRAGSDDNANPAQIKGDIDRGRTGDKRPGFDPALAPVTTDAEAGGQPLTSEQVKTARQTQLEGETHEENTVSYNDAMREFDRTPPSDGWFVWKVAAAVVILIVVIAAVFVLSSF
jgi:hypothetical protein